MSKRFILVASYPKSGNTWARVVFERLRRGPRLPLNSLSHNFHSGMLRQLFDQYAPVNAADLLRNEMDALFPGVYRELASDTTGQVFLKVHDAVRRTQLGEWYYPPECVQSAVYLVRHPYDVAVSAAHHFGVSVPRAIELMADDEAMERAYSRLPWALPQYFGTWSENVLSWLDDPPYEVTFARYEDLLADPLAGFERLAASVGLARAPHDLAEVVEASRFERLQAEEEQHGFSEKPKNSPQFFRTGQSRTWEGVLDEEAREHLYRDHGQVMARLGYRADGGLDAMPA